jgi:hypothetical protein
MAGAQLPLEMDAQTFLVVRGFWLARNGVDPLLAPCHMTTRVLGAAAMKALMDAQPLDKFYVLYSGGCGLQEFLKDDMDNPRRTPLFVRRDDGTIVVAILPVENIKFYVFGIPPVPDQRLYATKVLNCAGSGGGPLAFVRVTVHASPMKCSGLFVARLDCSIGCVLRVLTYCLVTSGNQTRYGHGVCRFTGGGEFEFDFVDADDVALPKETEALELWWEAV